MAEKLLLYIKHINELKGIEGQTKLAQIIKIPIIKAAMEPDTPENIQKFRDAILQITGENPPQM